jgi:hypothetical protein
MTGDGIHFISNFDSSLSISNSFVGNNGGYGILVQPRGSASVTAVFERVRTQYNGANAYGISLDATVTTGTVNGTATDSVSSNNGGGFLVQGGNLGGNNNLMVLRSVVSNNHTALQGDLNPESPSPAILRVSETTVTNNILGCNGFVNTYGDNTINTNVSVVR